MSILHLMRSLVTRTYPCLSVPFRKAIADTELKPPLVQSDISKEAVRSKRFSAFAHLSRRSIAYYEPHSYLRRDELVCPQNNI